MKGKIYLHIGPPKTATTALQYLFQNGISGKLFYGGVTQPRSEMVELSGRLHNLCVLEGNITVDAIQILQEYIAKILDDGINILISEEMFLVDSGSVSHQVKLARLSDILGCFYPVIILCARNPLEGLMSFYQEIYDELTLKQKISFKCFLNGNQAKIFDYAYLFDVLKKNGFHDLRIISFDRLVDGKLNNNDFFGGDFSSDQSIILSKKNSGRYVDSVAHRELGPYRVRDIFNPNRSKSRFLSLLCSKNKWIVAQIERFAGLPLTRKRIRHLRFSDIVKKKYLFGYAVAVIKSESLGRK